MAAEFRHILCSGCERKLRITISEKNYGSTVRVVCPECKARTQTTIPVPVPEKNKQGDKNKPEQSAPDHLKEVWNSLDSLFGPKK